LRFRPSVKAVSLVCRRCLLEQNWRAYRFKAELEQSPVHVRGAGFRRGQRHGYGNDLR